MKCIKSPTGDKITRLSDERSEFLVRNEGWTYCPKKEWKEKVRDVVINPKELKNKNRSKNGKV